jgi:DNA-binding LacI/PurR family transcriptional regulator
MGYVRNVAGAMLATGKTQSIMFVMPDVAPNYYSLYQMDVLGGLIDEASKHGYSVTVVPERMLPGAGAELFESFRSFRVDGAVLLLVRAKEPQWEIAKTPYPIVVVNRIIDDLKADFVVADDQHGAYEATRHLIERGHRELAFIGGPTNNFNAMRRRAGFEEALKAYGLNPDRRLISSAVTISREGGFQTASTLLNSAKSFTAVFCGVDILAVGAMQAIRRHGLRVPHDLSIVGFDDDSFASITEPPLTTVRKPRYEMGKAAGRLLIDRIEGRSQGGPITQSLETQLIVRETAANRTAE